MKGAKMETEIVFEDEDTLTPDEVEMMTNGQTAEQR